MLLFPLHKIQQHQKRQKKERKKEKRGWKARRGEKSGSARLPSSFLFAFLPFLLFFFFLFKGSLAATAGQQATERRFFLFCLRAKQKKAKAKNKTKTSKTSKIKKNEKTKLNVFFSLSLLLLLLSSQLTTTTTPSSNSGLDVLHPGGEHGVDREDSGVAGGDRDAGLARGLAVVRGGLDLGAARLLSPGRLLRGLDHLELRAGQLGLDDLVLRQLLRGQLLLGDVEQEQLLEVVLRAAEEVADLGAPGAGDRVEGGVVLSEKRETD